MLLALAGCRIEGGVEREPPVADAPGAAASPNTTPATAATSAPVASAPVASAEASPGDGAAAVGDSGLRIGMLANPADLLPYHDDSADERVTAPISQLLFPAPLLALSYGYTTTGVLERVPSLENGDVVIAAVDVYLDATGAITTTATETITQVQQISVTFRWNPRLAWSDGAPLRADDSLFAYQLARQTSLGQETAGKLALLDRYELIDEQTTRAVLKPDFTDPAYVTTFFTPLPRHLLQDKPLSELRNGQYALLPVGYGPYLVEQRDQGNLRLKRNPNYGGPAPAIDTLSFVFRDNLELLRSSVTGGSLDLVAADQPSPETLAAMRADAEQGSLQVYTVASPIWEHLDFNLDVPALQDIRVRRAIAHALNRDALAGELLGGYGAPLDSWIVPGQWAAAPPEQLTRYPHNPDEARRLLDEALLVDSDGDGLRESGGQPFTLNLITTQGSALRLRAAEQLRADLAAVGIGLSVQEVPTAALYGQDGPLFRRSFELALFAWIAGPDPRGWERWSCAGVPNEDNNWTGNNFPGWCFFDADKAIRTATTSLNQEERTAAYLRQQQLFTQELPVLPLFQRVDVTLVSPTIVGVAPDATAPFTWNIASWTRK